jgi:hypothetical protein
MPTMTSTIIGAMSLPTIAFQSPAFGTWCVLSGPSRIACIDGFVSAADVTSSFSRTSGAAIDGATVGGGGVTTGSSCAGCFTTG